MTSGVSRYISLLLTAASFDTGHSDYSTKRQNQQTHLNDLSKSIDLLDKYLESQYAELPSKIRAAYTAKLEENNAANHRFGQISLAIASGTAIRQVATVLGAGAAGLSQAQTLGIVASLLGGGGYSIDRAIKVRDPNPGCGLRDYEGVLAQYSGLFNLRQVYSGSSPSYTSYEGGSSSSYQQPEVLGLMTERLEKDLKTKLSCLIVKNGGPGRKLERCIDNLIETLEKRLHVTQEFKKITSKIHSNENNYV